MLNQRRMVVLLACAVSSIAYARNPFEFETPVTPVAEDTLHVHNLFLGIIGVLFVLGVAILFYSIYKHRKSRDYRPASFTGPRGRKQWLFAVIPFLALVFIDFVVMGIPAYHAAAAMANTQEDAQLVIKVTGSQWKWQYEYPDQGLNFYSTLSTPPDEFQGHAPKDQHYLREVDHPLVLPVGEKVRILLASTDVIHSWWVPAFGVKQDAVPGFLRESWVKIDKPGVYRGQCAELCGVGHAYMPIVVVAKDQADFQQWLAQAKAAQASEAAESQKSNFTRTELFAMGKKVFDTNCAACHQANGLGIAGVFPPIAAGKPFSATPTLLTDLTVRGFYKDGKIVLGPIKNHLGIILHGVPGTPMPAFAGQLGDAEIAAVVTFERNSFGNQTGDMVEPAEVKALRAVP